MKESRIASRYAKALFDLAQEQKVLDVVTADMKLVLGVVTENKEFNRMLTNPIVKADKKQLIFEEVFGKHVHKLSLAFLGIIIRKNREAFVDAIAENFIGQYNELSGIKQVTLKTAVAIDEGMKEKIVTAVKAGQDIQVELADEVDKNLLGGFVLSFDNQQYDASIRSKLQRLVTEFDS